MTPTPYTEERDVSESNAAKDDQLNCWCGASGSFEELFSKDIPSRCGGIGIIYCRCGGDLCACHYHGEVDCDGCPDCEDYSADDEFEAPNEASN